MILAKLVPPEYKDVTSDSLIADMLINAMLEIDTLEKEIESQNKVIEGQNEFIRAIKEKASTHEASFVKGAIIDFNSVFPDERNYKFILDVLELKKEEKE